MGYDIYSSDCVEIKADDVPAALAAIRKLAQDNEDDGEENTDSFEKLVDDLSESIFSAHKSTASSEGAIIIEANDEFRHLENAEELFDTLAPFLNGQSLHFRGEDDAEWAWVFKDGKRGEDEATKVWGDDIKKIAAFDKVLEILYPKGEVRTSFPKGTLNKLADSLRKSGFGPFANLSDLEAIAKAAE